jgi:hypothetical protein
VGIQSLFGSVQMFALWQKVAFSKFYLSSINKRRTIANKSGQNSSTFANNISNGIFLKQIKGKI